VAGGRGFQCEFRGSEEGGGLEVSECFALVG